jgi:hypothetical protein
LRRAEYLEQEAFELAELERKVQHAAQRLQATYRGFTARNKHIPKQRRQKELQEQWGLAAIFEQYCAIQCKEMRKRESAHQEAEREAKTKMHRDTHTLRLVTGELPSAIEPEEDGTGEVKGRKLEKLKKTRAQAEQMAKEKGGFSLMGLRDALVDEVCSLHLKCDETPPLP